MTEPSPSRAVLSNEDFILLREAVRYFIENHQDDPVSSKYSALYHRLDSAGGRSRVAGITPTPAT